MKFNKEQFQMAVRMWAASADDDRSELTTSADKFVLDPEINAAWIKVLEADNAMAQLCKKKLEKL